MGPSTPRDSIIAALYDAALDPARWTDAMRALARAIDAPNGLFYVLDKERMGPAHAEFVGHSDQMQREYVQHYHTLDPHLEPGLRAPVGQWLYNHEMFDARFFARNEYVNDFMLRHAHKYVAYSRVHSEERFDVFLAYQSAHDQAPFDAADRTLLAAFTPHLQRAAQIALRLSQAEYTASLARPAFERLDFPVLVLDAGCRAAHLNPAALALLRTGEVISMSSGAVVCRDAASQCALEELVRNAIAGNGGGALLCAAATGVRFEAICAPLAPHADQCTAWQRPLALLVLHDRRAAPAAGEAALAGLFGLTHAEARLARALIEGKSLDSHADGIGVGIETVRTQLRALFAKTGTHRQAELIALIGRLPALRVVPD